MLTIYNTTVPVTSQEQADRLKKACVYNGLAVYNDFSITERGIKFNLFGFRYGVFSTWAIIENSTKITESEWMELLTKTKNDEEITQKN